MGPIIGILNELRADWIVTHVIPFLCVAFVAAQHVVEESTLPDWVRAFVADNRLLEALLEHSRPSSQFEIVRSTDEQMNVIGHDDVATHRDVVIGVGALCEANECVVNDIGGEQSAAPIGARRDKPDGVVWKRARKSGRKAGNFFTVAAALWAA
jgi:hypothetical protein